MTNVSQEEELQTIRSGSSILLLLTQYDHATINTFFTPVFNNNGYLEIQEIDYIESARRAGLQENLVLSNNPNTWSHMQ